MEERTIHWDKFPKGTGFAVSEFKEEPHREQYGILASLPDGSWAWVACSEPPDLVAVPNREMAQSVLTNLRSYSKMKQVAEEAGDWGKTPSEDGLPDPTALPTVHWDHVPENTRLQARQFRGGVWWIVAQMPDGEHLVMLLDRLVRDAGYFNPAATREEIERTIAWLEMTNVPPDPRPKSEQRKKRAKEVVRPPSFGPDGPPSQDLPEGTDLYLIAAVDRAAEADRPKIAALEKEWRRRLAVGKKKSCLCSQCRHVIRRKAVEILDWYDRPEVFENGDPVSELFLDAYRLFNLLSQL